MIVGGGGALGGGLGYNPCRLLLDWLYWFTDGDRLMGPARWPHRLAWSRTPGSHPGNAGSNPAGVTLMNARSFDSGRLFFCGIVSI